MRKTIYVKSDEVWETVKELAKKQGVSVSEYLISGGQVASLETLAEGNQLDRIEKKLDRLIKSTLRNSEGGLVEGRVIRSDDEVLKEAQEKLQKIREKKKFFNPQPKG